MEQETNNILYFVRQIVSGDSKRAVAKKLGISESMIGLLLKGHRTWTPKYLERIETSYSLTLGQRKMLHKLGAIASGFRVD